MYGWSVRLFYLQYLEEQKDLSDSLEGGVDISEETFNNATGLRH